jgi:hypothetical protein
MGGNSKTDTASAPAAPRSTQKTLLIYSGPTSTDRTQDKNGMYIDNMNYFLKHGVSCPNDQQPQRVSAQAEPVDVRYVFVVTQDVADYYTAPDGLVTKKRRECQQSSSTTSAEEHIKVIVRKDRCYDMESMRVVLDQMDVEKNYDNLLFVNCGLVGPKCEFLRVDAFPLCHRPNRKFSQLLESIPSSTTFMPQSDQDHPPTYPPPQKSTKTKMHHPKWCPTPIGHKYTHPAYPTPYES